MICKRCEADKDGSLFYPRDSTCKECRKALVRQNRAEKADYYREYDKKRFQEDPRVKARQAAYFASPQGRATANAAKGKWAEENRTKRAAEWIVTNAVRDGRLFKPDDCEQCGHKPDRLHGHHDDYSKPLTVRWLCPKCHTAWHKQNGPGLNG